MAQGFFSGTCMLFVVSLEREGGTDAFDADNAIAGRINGPKGVVGDVSGKWSDVMEITRKNVRLCWCG